MSELKDYVQIMVESLRKKSIILDRLITKNEVQAKCLESGEFDTIDWDTFNLAMSEKEAEINRLNDMDAGFQALYDRIGTEIKNNANEYKSQIKEMQALISEIEAKSVKVQTGEAKNREIIEKVMTGRKKEIKKARMSLKAVSSYYQSMQRGFMDGGSSVNETK